MRAAEEGSHTVAGDKQLFAGDNDTDLDLIPGNQLLVGSISWNLTVELAQFRTSTFIRSTPTTSHQQEPGRETPAREADNPVCLWPFIPDR
jgi:hypothetical protein